MKDFLEYLIKSIVTNENDVSVEEENIEEGVVKLKVRVNKEDIGLVIGKAGRVVKSLKNLVKVKAIKMGKRVDIDVIDED